MIYSTFVAPTEFVPNLTQIKRALLTFDKVFIPDPSDRDLIPPQSFLSALGMPFLGLNVGPVRPLGKCAQYDSLFDKLVDECRVAREEGLLEVISSYEQSQRITIGAVPMGDYPLDPGAMLFLYRSMARDNDFLRIAIQNDRELLMQGGDFIESIAIRNCRADGGINDDPATPLIEGTMFRPELREALTEISRARLAAALKTIGFCCAKNVIPFFSGDFYTEIGRRIMSNASNVIDNVATEDPYWANRSLALRVAHQEYIDEQILEQMPIQEVIRLRTKAWGDQANAREDLLKSVAEIAREAGPSDDFEAKCKEKVRAYRGEAEKLERERSALKLRVKCEIGMGVGGMSLSIGAGNIAQVQTAIGAATTLVAGCVFALQRIKEYGPVSAQLRAAEQEFKDRAGFGLHQFFKNVPQQMRK